MYLLYLIQVGPHYPHEPPKVKCETLVYHPNIDLEGNVCLNILREDWKPVLTINAIIYGLQYLFSVSFIYIFFALFGEMDLNNHSNNVITGAKSRRSIE